MPSRSAILLFALALVLAPTACGETSSDAPVTKAPKAVAPPSDAVFEKLAALLPLEGFDKRPGGRASEGYFVGSYLSIAANPQGVRMEVSVSIQPCTRRLCPPKGLTTATVKGMEPRLLHRKRWSMGHRANDKRTEAFADVAIEGRNALTVWVESLVIKDTSRSGMRGYHLYRANGASLVHIAVRPFGDISLLAKPDQWRAAFSRQQAEGVAKAWFALALKTLEG